MRKKYFFFDIDGTLTDRKTGQIVPSAATALDKLRAAGHFVAINTGRAHYKARIFFEENGFENMVCNGGKGIVIDKVLVENSPLVLDKARKLYREAMAAGLGVLVAAEDSERVWAADDRFRELVGPRREPTEYIIDPAMDIDAFPEIYKMYITIPEEQEDTLPALKELGHMWFEKDYVLVQQDDKRGGILRMLELVGGDPEDVVVFGDDTNDMDMFTPPFYRIAMGNGHPDLKAAADEVAPANIDDGIYRVCEEHGWFLPVSEDKAPVTAADSGASDSELCRRLLQKYEENKQRVIGTVDEYLVPEILYANDSERCIVFAYTFYDWMRNVNGVMHGGYVNCLMDSALGYLASACQPGALTTPTLQLNVSFVNPVPQEGRVCIRARIDDIKSRIVFVSGTMYLEREPERTLVRAMGQYYRTVN